MYKLSDYDYYLPPELIAQQKTNPPHQSKMLVYHRDTGESEHKKFRDLKDMLDGNYLMFFNKTKVIKARLVGQIDGKQAEIFYLRNLENWHFEALVRPWKKFKKWKIIEFQIDDEILRFEVVDFTKDWRALKLLEGDILQVLEKWGQMPLPPYIAYEESKESSYQPVLAKEAWSVAAPTASLHFSPELLEALKTKWVKMEEVVLHVGLGTFKKVDVEDIRQYDIHTEQVKIHKDIFAKIAKAKLNSKKILAVGTTVVRTLESLPALWQILPQQIKEGFPLDVQNFRKTQKWNDKEIIYNFFVDWDNLIWETKLFIYPWFEFKIVDSLITNFHLPRSSLLMLVAAFVGYEQMKQIYEIAIKHKYKFYSFWDWMFIL